MKQPGKSGNPIRVSIVDFLNARPLTWGLLHEPPAGVEVLRDPPAVCAERLSRGEVDAGLIPSIEYQRLAGLQVVGGLGIAASSEVRSVLLVSRVSRERISSVSLDPASRTSAALTRILLKRRYGLAPRYEERSRGMGEDADASLIIGDPALKARLNGQVVLDLAAEWRAFSGHPFVFAFWAVHPGSPAGELAGILRRSRDAAVAQFDRLVEEEAADSGLSQAVIRDYLLHALHYELDEGDLEGLKLFYELAAEDRLIEEAKPLRFV
ncbi:MAG: menaquinone biosynthesis protein [Thermoanaerobaculia bacterium]|nr:menaquinone biosynthesis protein [Thermoanaerobaculia bacterium]